MKEELFSKIILPGTKREPVRYSCGDGAEMLLYEGMGEEQREIYRKQLMESGFDLVDEYEIPGSSFATLRRDGLTLVWNRFGEQLRLIADPYTAAYRLADPCPRTEKTTLWLVSDPCPFRSCEQVLRLFALQHGGL